MNNSEAENKKFAVCASQPEAIRQPKINISTTTKAYRKTVSFKCNEELWQIFKTACKTNGTSICHILEAMVTAYVSLADLRVNFGDTYTVENLNVQRVVQKHRRVSHEYFKEPNMYDSKGRWIFVTNADLNENGHALGCCCKACMQLTGDNFWSRQDQNLENLKATGKKLAKEVAIDGCR